MKGNKGNFKHGMSHRHPLYGVWRAMKQRCHSPSAKTYRLYGGRGIRVCVAWKESFRSFFEWSIDAGWKPGLQIDRIDNDDGYSPWNCRFVSHAINSRNTRRTKLSAEQVIQIRDDPRSSRVLAKELGLKDEHIRSIRQKRIWKDI